MDERGYPITDSEKAIADEAIATGNIAGGRDTLDHAENTALSPPGQIDGGGWQCNICEKVFHGEKAAVRCQATCMAMNTNAPLVGPAACIEDRLALVVSHLHGGLGCATVHEAIKAGQDALVLCRKLVLLETTDPVLKQLAAAEDTIRSLRRRIELLKLQLPNNCELDVAAATLPVDAAIAAMDTKKGSE
jgi:hypothetical protein